MVKLLVEGRLLCESRMIAPTRVTLSSLAPLSGRYRLRISPQAFPLLSCCHFQPVQHCISRRILSIPPAPAVLILPTYYMGVAESYPEGVALAALT